MRTLNRPMFRMGGPIKEGVMHGIREPRRGGGRAALVGNPMYPSTMGREHHSWYKSFIPKGIMGSTVTKKPSVVGSVWDKIKNIYKTPPSTSKELVPYDKTLAAKQMPGLGTNRWWWQKAARPTLGAVKKTAGAVAPYATTGTLGYLGYQGAKGFWPDGTPKTNPELLNMNNIQPGSSGPPGGGDKDMTYTDPEKAKKLAAKKRDDRITGLLETMGYDAAKRGAIGKALIDASQIVTERGTLDKKNITQELINPIIAATSKRLEKPEQLNEAVRLMLTKAEIEKEMNPLKNEALRWQIEASKKTLKGKTIAETIAEAAGKNTPLTGETLASSARALLPGDFKVMQLKVPKKTDTLEHIIDVVKESHTNPNIDPFPAGQYVLKERIVKIDEQGNVTPLDI